MNKLTMILMLMFVALNLFCQDFTFEKVLKENFVPFIIDKSCDSNFFILGHNNSSPTGPVIIKTDSLGNELWSHQYGDGLLGFECSDSLIICCGGSYFYGMTLFSINNNNGDILWSKNYGAVWEYPLFTLENITKTTDNNFISCGQKGEPGNWDAFIVKINRNGDSIWSRSYNEISDCDYIFPISDGCYLACGGGVWFKIDALGNLLWSKNLFGNANTVIKSTDDNYLISGTYSINPTKSLIFKINALGDTLWTKMYSEEVGEIYSISENIDGSIISVGNRVNEGTIGKYDSEGNFIWLKSDLNLQRILSLYLLNNGYLVVGEGAYGGQYYGKGYLIRTDVEGCVHKTILSTDKTPPYCEGDEINIQVLKDGTNFIWSNGDTTQNIFTSSPGQYYCSFIDNNGCWRITDTLTIFPTPDVSITPINPSPICLGDSIKLSSINEYSSYLWSNGSTNPFIYVKESGNYFVQVTENGCSSISDSVTVKVISPFQEQEICLVSVDSLTNKNLIVFDKPIDEFIQSFNIYKETNQSENYELIGSLDFNSPGIFTDNSSNPLVTSNKYKISIIDSCDNESLLSNFHKTIHLTSNIGLNGEINLIWNPYEGFNYLTFNIFRCDLDGNLTILGQVPANNYSFTDINHPTGTLLYFVEVENLYECSPYKGYKTSRSNIINIDNIGISEYQFSDIVIIPNPASDVLNIQFETGLGIMDAQLNIFDIQGKAMISKQIQQEKTNINIGNLNPGVYIIRVEYDQNLVTSKLIVY